MADELRSPDGNNTTPPPLPPQIPTDVSGISTVYTNHCRANMTAEELVLDFGLNPSMVGNPDEPVKLSHRVVMSFFTAKRLQMLLAHVIQQRNGAAAGAARRTGDAAALERQAQRAATRAVGGGTSRALGAAPAAVQRRVPMRDVGRGEQSGFARVGELIDRLNAMPGGQSYAVTDGLLTDEVVDQAALTEFDRQMQGFIDADSDIPMRFTNRHGLEGDRVNGFNSPVDVDSFQSGYVDIDDLLASSDLGLQTSLVHLLRERGQAANYARRIGTAGLNPVTVRAGRQEFTAEFNRAHASGIDAELQVLRDFFSDPAIRLIDADSRRFRNTRGDLIREREQRGTHAADAGVLAISWEVVRHDGGEVMTPEDYLQFIDAERTREQVNRERLNGATEHREGGRSVPAP